MCVNVLRNSGYCVGEERSFPNHYTHGEKGYNDTIKADDCYEGVFLEVGSELEDCPRFKALLEADTATVQFLNRRQAHQGNKYEVKSEEHALKQCIV